MSNINLKENSNFIDNSITYELSKKQVYERLQWLDRLDEEHWFTIKHIVNDLKELSKKTANIAENKKSIKKLEDENKWLSKKIHILQRNIETQNQSIKVLTKHICEIKGVDPDDAVEVDKILRPLP